MIAFLQSIVLLLTLALQPTTPPEMRDHIVTSVVAIMQQVKVEQPQLVPIITTPMTTETPSPSVPAPAPSAPETPSATPVVAATPNVDPTPQIELTAEGNSLQWKTRGVGEILKCTLDGLAVEQEGERLADSGTHILVCVGVKSGQKVFREITI